MKFNLFKRAKTAVFAKALLSAGAFVFAPFLFAGNVSGQTVAAPQDAGERAVSPANPSAPRVTQIDAVMMQTLLKREGETAKPLLVNFWATWCVPCREEFPDLVKIDAQYRGKIDFITVSLDDLAEIDGDVPKFLSEMKAEMPAYLLKTGDEDAAISSVSEKWSGGLPFTILFDKQGATAYSRMGKVKLEVLRAEIEKLIK